MSFAAAQHYAPASRSDASINWSYTGIAGHCSAKYTLYGGEQQMGLKSIKIKVALCLMAMGSSFQNIFLRATITEPLEM